MTKTYDSPFVQNVAHIDGSIGSADTTTKKLIFTAGSNDSVIKSLNFSSTDTVAANVQLFINVGGSGTDRLIATIPVPLSSGNLGTVAAVDAFRSSMISHLSFDGHGNKVLNLKAGSTLKAAVLATLSSGKQIDIFGEAGDF